MPYSICKFSTFLTHFLQRAKLISNKGERYSRVPRLSDTRYSAKQPAQWILNVCAAWNDSVDGKNNRSLKMGNCLSYGSLTGSWHSLQSSLLPADGCPDPFFKTCCRITAGVSPCCKFYNCYFVIPMCLYVPWIEHPCRSVVLKRLKHFPATGLLSVSWLNLRERRTNTELVFDALKTL